MANKITRRQLVEAKHKMENIENRDPKKVMAGYVVLGFTIVGAYTVAKFCARQLAQLIPE